jgi:polygalacturonase
MSANNYCFNMKTHKSLVSSCLFIGCMILISVPLLNAQNKPAGKGITWKTALPSIPKNEISILNYGGVGDGKALNTEVFAKAIDALSAKGGGKLIVPAGIWLTGPVQLKSNIELHLNAGAMILFSRDFSLYPLLVVDMKGEKEVCATSPLSGSGLKNIAITGSGIIDGGGDAWRPMKKSKLTENDWKALVKSGGVLSKSGDTWYPNKAVMDGGWHVSNLIKKGSLDLKEYEPWQAHMRPKMIRFINCKKVLIKDVIIQNPPNWTINPVLCEDVSLLNVTVKNNENAQNSDALDLESCRRALIKNCVFDVGDDGICLKSGKDEIGRRIGVPTEDVLVEDCTVFHAHGGFTIGSEMSGGVKNVFVNNCTFIGTDIGLRFKSTRGRGGVVEKIYISNIMMSGITGDAINFNLYYGGKSPLDDTSTTIETNVPAVNEETPQFKDIHIKDVVCRGAKAAIVLQGLPEMPLQNISLANVTMTSQKGVSVIDADGITFDNVKVENAAGQAIKTLRVKNSKLDLVK